MVIDYLFRVVHAAVTDLDGVSVKDFNSSMGGGFLVDLKP